MERWGVGVGTVYQDPPQARPCGRGRRQKKRRNPRVFLHNGFQCKLQFFVLFAKAGQVAPDTGCGQDISMRDVMVLDLEPFGNDLEITQEYLFEHAGEFHLLDTRPEEMIMRSRPTKGPHGMLRQAKETHRWVIPVCLPLQDL